MKIEPKHATFEQAKWLKEKGFDMPCFYYYENGALVEPYLENGSSTDTEFRVDLSDLLEHFNKHSKRVSAPEQWQVVEWLRVKHKLHLSIVYSHDHNKYSCNIFDQLHADELRKRNPRSEGRFPYPYKSECLRHYWNYNSPQEAYSEAFDYIKNNNLI